MIDWVYLSPHLDDAILSCGGIIWNQVQSGQKVEIWSICTANPPADQPLSPFAASLHARWQTGAEAFAIRRLEDKAATRQLGAGSLHFNIPDCIYRWLPHSKKYLIQCEEDLWQDLHPEEAALQNVISRKMKTQLQKPGYRTTRVVCPLGIGGHIDHRMVHAAALQLPCNRYFYAEYPYAANPEIDLQDWASPEWEQISFGISDGALEMWQAAVAKYSSQISTFWQSLEIMRAALANYCLHGGGGALWKEKIARNTG